MAESKLIIQETQNDHQDEGNTSDGEENISFDE